MRPRDRTALTYSRNREGARPDGDEYTRSLGIPWQFLCHQTVHKRGQDHKRKVESCSLDDQRGQGHRQHVDPADQPCLDGRVDEVCAKRSGDQKRVRWKDPDGRHSVDGKDQCRPEYQVYTCAGESGCDNPDPKQNLHRNQQPRACIGNAILAYIDEDGAHTSPQRQIVLTSWGGGG